nr:hypothetical protein [Desulfobulbaceae bacterium]
MKLKTVGIFVLAGSLWFAGLAQAEDLFFDDFSTDLSSWNATEQGKWLVKNDELYSHSNAGCEKTNCPHSDLLLNDAIQPTGSYKASFDFRKTVSASQSKSLNTVATFVLWKDENNKIAIAIGDQSQPHKEKQHKEIGVVLSSWDGESWLTDASDTFDYDWDSDDWHTASLEKNGAIYSIYIDDIFLTEFEDSFLSGKGKIGIHGSATVTADNFVLSEITRPVSKCPRQR